MILQYTIYDAITGENKRYGECNDISFQGQCQTGEVIAEGYFPNTYWDGVDIQPMPDRPSKSYDFDWTLKTWTPNIVRAKTYKWLEIKNKRDEAIAGGFMSQTRPFQSDVESQSRIMGAVQVATVYHQGSTWTCTDNTTFEMDVAQVIQLGADLATHIGGAYTTGRDLRDVIEAATTAEEIDAIQWPT